MGEEPELAFISHEILSITVSTLIDWVNERGPHGSENFQQENLKLKGWKS